MSTAPTTLLKHFLNFVASRRSKIEEFNEPEEIAGEEETYRVELEPEGKRIPRWPEREPPWFATIL